MTDNIKEYQHHDTDSGSPEVQIIRLTERINQLTEHLKEHRKDHSSRQGLLKMVSRRRSLLSYLKRHQEATYRALINSLSLRK